MHQSQWTKTQVPQKSSVPWCHLRPQVELDPHLLKTKEKIANNVVRLSRIQGNDWGVRETTMKKINKAIIDKQITYGAEIWWVGTKRMTKTLNTIQRPALLRITKCFRTVSTDALQLLTGLPPVFLICDSLATLHKLKQKKSICISEEIINHDDNWTLDIIDPPPLGSTRHFGEN